MKICTRWNIVVTFDSNHAPKLGCNWKSQLSNLVGFETMPFRQCDQIWRFLKVFCNKCSLKSSPTFGELLGLFWKTPLLRKTVAVTFGVTFGKIGQLYFLTSGHTAFRFIAERTDHLSASHHETPTFIYRFSGVNHSHGPRREAGNEAGGWSIPSDRREVDEEEPAQEGRKSRIRKLCLSSRIWSLAEDQPA